MKYSLCKVPGCSGYVTNQGKELGLCNKHVDQMNFLLWALEHIKVKEQKEPGKTESGLYLPPK